MKKIFTYLAVAALVAVACDDMYGPVETPVAPDKAGSVEIQIDTLGDDTLAFTLSPVGDAAYYSYFVAAGPAQAVDSAAVYQCKLDGLIKGTFKAAEDSVAHLAVGELAPNTPYTIYAVAGSPMGIAGSIAVKEVVTTDGITIKVVDFDDTVTDSTVVLTFSEEVFPGKGEITATYYASNLGFKEMGTVKAVADSVIYEGNTVTVQFAGLPHGAYWAVSYPEGTFTDSAQNKIAALTSGYSAEAQEMVGVCSRKDTVAFNLVDTLAKEQLLFLVPEDAEFTVEVDGEEELAKYNKTGKVNFVTSQKTVTIPFEEGKTLKYAKNDKGKYQITMYLPDEKIDFGTSVVIDYPQDAFQDIWGNPTKAVQYKSQYSYGWKLKDVCGKYEFVEISAFGEQYDNVSSMTIEESDNPEKGDVMITEYNGIKADVSPIYADMDFDSGVLTVKSGQVFATEVDDEGTWYLEFAVGAAEGGYLVKAKEGATVDFYIFEANVILGPSEYYGYYYLDSDKKDSGWGNAYYSCKATLAGTDETATSAFKSNLSPVHFVKR